MGHQAVSSFIWSITDLLRGDYKQPNFGTVILPFTILSRLDRVLDAAEPAALDEFDTKTKVGPNPEPFVMRKVRQSFSKTPALNRSTLLGD
jgi:type I restriction enzyme M protein